MVVINLGLQTLTDEIIIPHSGWRKDSVEACKLLSAEWTTVFKNTSGCLRFDSPSFARRTPILRIAWTNQCPPPSCRNVSSDGAEARQRLRECEGLVDALLHALQSAVINKDTDNKVTKISSPKFPHSY